MMWIKTKTFLKKKKNKTKKKKTENKDDHYGELRTTRGFSIDASRHGVKDTLLRCDTSKHLHFSEVIFWRM